MVRNRSLVVRRPVSPRAVLPSPAAAPQQPLTPVVAAAWAGAGPALCHCARRTNSARRCGPSRKASSFAFRPSGKAHRNDSSYEASSVHALGLNIAGVCSTPPLPIRNSASMPHALLASGVLALGGRSRSAAAAGPAGRKKRPPLIVRWFTSRRLVDSYLLGQSFCRSLASLALSSGAILGTRGINAVPSMAPYWVFLLRHVLPVHLVAQCLLRFRRRGSLHLPAASVRQRLNLAAVIFAANTLSRTQEGRVDSTRGPCSDGCQHTITRPRTTHA